MVELVTAFDQIEPHVLRLLTPSRDRKALAFFSTNRESGFVLQNDRGHVDVTFPVEWRDQPETEAAIRAFFASLGVTPWRDYLAGNGDVADATRIVAFPLSGDTTVVAALTKRILTELCGVAIDDSVIIQYTEGLP